MILACPEACILELLVDLVVMIAFSVYKLKFFPLNYPSGLLFWLYFIYLQSLIRETNVALSWADANFMFNKERAA